MRNALTKTLVLLLATTSITFVSASAQALSPRVCTISGDAKPNVLVGTAFDDVICGGDGRDIIYGFGGNDILLGESGNDLVYGGEGQDELIGGNGNDRLSGGQGNDRLSGGDGVDNISGDIGDDLLDGGSSNDVLSGGEDEDLIRGSSGNDQIIGGSGDDSIDGGSGKDSIRTNNGDDTCKKDKTDIHLDSCNIDSTSPVIGLTTAVIREFTAGEEFTLSWNVSDVSGVEKSWASIGGPSGWVTEWCGFAIEAELVSGDSKEGSYQIKCQAPEQAPNQTYTLFVSASDKLGNSTVNASQFSFVILGGSSDVSTPEITSSQAPETVSLGSTFDVEIAVKDENEIKFVYGWFMLERGGFADAKGLYIPALDQATLVSGSERDGIFKQSFKPNANAPAGKYTLWISVSDILGNREMVTSETVVLVTK